jgi:recombination protein RecA
VAAKYSSGLKQVMQNVVRLFAFPTMIIPTRPEYKEPVDIPILPTGLRPLDKALGIGGLPYGKIVELIGPGVSDISDGTHCIAGRIAARVQRRQEIVTIIDMNHSVDPWQAERSGLMAPQLLLTRPDTVFAALTSLESAAQNADMVIVVMGIVTELLRDIETDLLKTLLQRLRHIVRRSNCIFLFVTALTKNDPFNPTNYPAGFPLAELADVRLWVQDETWTRKDGLTTAYKANVTVIKNELAMVGRGAGIRIKLAGV